jgi:hypothetical protein
MLTGASDCLQPVGLSPSLLFAWHAPSFLPCGHARLAIIIDQHCWILRNDTL